MNVRQSLILITLLSSLALTGCASDVKQIEISTTPVEKPPLVLPKTTKIKMRDVKWIVVNKENVDSILADMESKGQNVVLFTLTDKGYEALSLNTADLRKLVQEQQAIIAAYKQYYEASQAALDDANKEIDSTKKKVDEANADNSKSCAIPLFCRK